MVEQHLKQVVERLLATVGDEHLLGAGGDAVFVGELSPQAEDARATTAEGLATLKEALQGGTRRTAIRAIGRIERPELIGLVAAAIHDGVGIRADELDRVTRKDTRPLLRNTDSRATLERLLKQREPLYAQADITVESDAGPHEMVVKRILAALDARDRQPSMETQP